MELINHFNLNPGQLHCFVRLQYIEERMRAAYHIQRPECEPQSSRFYLRHVRRVCYLSL